MQHTVQAAALTDNKLETAGLVRINVCKHVLPCEGERAVHFRTTCFFGFEKIVGEVFYCGAAFRRGHLQTSPNKHFQTNALSREKKGSDA